MDVIYLGKASEIASFLHAREQVVCAATNPITPAEARGRFLVSYGYRHILRRDVLAACAGAVNVHISYLPWNRGADPVLWSVAEDRPAGVTVHHIDARLDTGDIIAQERVEFDLERDTLRTAYVKASAAAECLFMRTWPAIRAGTAPRTPQQGEGSYHRAADRERLSVVLCPLGWDTPLSALESYAAETEMAEDARLLDERWQLRE